MLFHLKTAWSTFQRTTDVVLSEVKWKFVLLYSDDVVIFSRSVEEHMILIHIWAVQGPIPRDRASEKLKKCIFFQNHFDYLGHFMPPARPGMSTKVTKAICRLQHFTNTTASKLFLVLCNVFRFFVPSFARLSTLLNCKFENHHYFYFWRQNEIEIEVIKTLQHWFLSPSKLVLSGPFGRYTFETDTCDRQVQFFSLQKQAERPPSSWGSASHWKTLKRRTENPKRVSCCRTGR